MVDKVYWFLADLPELPPSHIFDDPQPYNQNIGCPQTTALDKQRFTLHAPQDIVIDEYEGQFTAEMPYVFLSESDIQMYLLSKHKDFAEGLLNIKFQCKILNFTLVNPKQQTIKKGEPLMYVLFNRPVELIHIIPNDAIWRAFLANYRLADYYKGVTKLYSRIKKRFPYKELSKCHQIK
jgi:hypothetical protein